MVNEWLEYFNERKEIGEWERDETGRWFRRLGNHCKEYSTNDMMPFEVWMKRKKDEEQAITNGSEKVPGDHPLYKFYNIIRKYCIKDLPKDIPIYFMSDDFIKKNPDRISVYGYGRIMMNKTFYNTHKDIDILETLFHEMIHAYCDIKKIEDVIGEFHTKEFQRVCEQHGGFAEFSNDVLGYNDVYLREDTIKEMMR